MTAEPTTYRVHYLRTGRFNLFMAVSTRHENHLLDSVTEVGGKLTKVEESAKVSQKTERQDTDSSK